MKKNPKKWTEVYPAGTSRGDEEARFFRSLSRNKQYEWRSVAALSKESNLSKERVEEIISKYYKLGIIFQNPKNEDYWGYWERVPHMIPEVKKSMCSEDKENRIDKFLKK
jgi:hypothetical protein